MRPVSAETLRRAALLMRERTEALPHHEPPWRRRPISQNGTCDACSETKDLVAAYDDPSGENEPWLCVECDADTAYIGSWQPPFALALADWLIHIANDVDNAFAPEIYVANSPSVQKALTVARLYLEEA